MNAAAHLRLVETGELPVDGPQTLAEAYALIAEQSDEIAGLERTVRSQGALIVKMGRDREAQAKNHEAWPVAERLHAIWKAATKNRSKSSKLTADRFELVLPFLKGHETDPITTEPGPPRNPVEECAAAIIGRAFDHFTTTRSNGTTKHFWEWTRIFASETEMHDSRDRRPRDWRERLHQCDPEAS